VAERGDRGEQSQQRADLWPLWNVALRPPSRLRNAFAIVATLAIAAVLGVYLSWFVGILVVGGGSAGMLLARKLYRSQRSGHH
jgi:hypothetical protein